MSLHYVLVVAELWALPVLDRAMDTATTTRQLLCYALSLHTARAWAVQRDLCTEGAVDATAAVVVVVVAIAAAVVVAIAAAVAAAVAAAMYAVRSRDTAVQPEHRRVLDESVGMHSAPANRTAANIRVVAVDTAAAEAEAVAVAVVVAVADTAEVEAAAGSQNSSALD